MIIGVKYCGGCNSVYNRGRQVNLLKEQFPEHEFRAASEGNVCDVWLVVCGCMRACASTAGLTASRRLFVLPTERSFVEIREFLEAEREKASGNGSKEESSAVAKSQQQKDGSEDGEEITDGRKKLRIGQEESMKKTFFKDDVDKFAALTGDYSRLHTDARFAKQSIYGRPVVHGVLAASLISSVMGMKLPGEGTVLVEEQVRFLKPVFYGDTVTARVRLLSCREGKRQYVASLAGVCTNQNGEMVAAARCRQLLSKELFEIENPEETAKMPEAEDFWE